MPKSPICPRGWAISPSSLLVVRDNTLMQWLIGFNSLGEWNSSGNCFSPSLDMWSEGKRLEIKFAKQISAVRVLHSKSDLYDWREQSSLHFQPQKVHWTFWAVRGRVDELFFDLLSSYPLPFYHSGKACQTMTCWQKNHFWALLEKLSSPKYLC